MHHASSGVSEIGLGSKRRPLLDLHESLSPSSSRLQQEILAEREKQRSLQAQHKHLDSDSYEPPPMNPLSLTNDPTSLPSLQMLGRDIQHSFLHVDPILASQPQRYNNVDFKISLDGTLKCCPTGRKSEHEVGIFHTRRGRQGTQ